MITDTRRQQLDGIVQKMVQARESDANVKFVVDDFKKKYEHEVEPKPAEKKSLGSKIFGVAKKIGNVAISAEKAFAKNIGSVFEQRHMDKIAPEIAAQNAETVANLTAAAYKRPVGDPRRQQLLDEAGKVVKTAAEMGEEYAASQPSTGEIIGNAAGVALDAVSAGTYGKAATAAKSAKLLKAAPAAKAVIPAVKQPLSATLKAIGKKTAQRAGVGAATGYAYDVVGNLQQGKTGGAVLKPGTGTFLGAAIPAAVGGYQASKAIAKDQAPRFINSLIKPKTADFSYGKDPGRTVAEMGITGSSVEDLGKNIGSAKSDVGSKIGSIYKSPKNSKLTVNVEQQLSKIDEAITEAAAGGKGNQSMVTTLRNVKDALLYEHRVNADGVIERVGKARRDLSKLPPEAAFEIKQLISKQTKFTGNPSDDKKVNAILKSVYGGIKDTLNNTVGKNNPEIIQLNQRYADLMSAELATLNRDAIIKKAGMVSMPIKIGTVTGIITAVATGGAAIPAVLLGTSAAVLDKALSSTPVRTRVAAWLAKESPGVIRRVISRNPGIKTVLYRVMPNLTSKLGR